MKLPPSRRVVKASALSPHSAAANFRRKIDSGNQSRKFTKSWLESVKLAKCNLMADCSTSNLYLTVPRTNVTCYNNDGSGSSGSPLWAAALIHTHMAANPPNDPDDGNSQCEQCVTLLVRWRSCIYQGDPGNPWQWDTVFGGTGYPGYLEKIAEYSVWLDYSGHIHSNKISGHDDTVDFTGSGSLHSYTLIPQLNMNIVDGDGCFDFDFWAITAGTYYNNANSGIAEISPCPCMS